MDEKYMQNFAAAVQQTKQPLPPAFSLLKWSLSFYGKHFGLIAGIVVIPMLVAVAALLLPEIIPLSMAATFILLALLVVSFVLSLISQMALLSAITQEGQTIGGAYKNGLRLFFPAIWVMILTVFVTFGGAFPFIIPGILLSVWLSASVYVLFAENRRGMSALVASWKYVKGYWWAVLWRNVVLGGTFLIIFLVVSVGFAVIIYLVPKDMAPTLRLVGNFVSQIFWMFVFTPISFIYFFSIYASLRQVKGAVDPAAPESHKSKRNLTILAVLGGIIVVLMIGFSAYMAVSFPSMVGMQPPRFELTFPQTPAAVFSSTLDFLNPIR